MKLDQLINVCSILSDNDDIKTYDLTTDEGYEGFKNIIEELKDSDNSLFSIFGIDMDELLDNMSKLGDKIHNESKKKQVAKSKEDIVKNNVNMQRQEVDHSEEEEEKKFKKPSEDLTINQKLQLHKIVQEYVDTMIKPYNNGLLTNQQINDAYAGLYEFAAWVMNK